MKMNFLSVAAACVGGWMILNGILHDIFVLLSEHGKQYDRNLLRLLLDGHILITCGVMQAIAVMGLRTHEVWAYYLGIAACLSLLVYIGMIFPFLKSFGSLVLNLALLVLLLIGYWKNT